MGIYKRNFQAAGGSSYKETLTLSELDVFGSSRVGLYTPKDNLIAESDFTATFTGKEFDNISEISKIRDGC